MSGWAAWNHEGWTYGAEHELADWSRDVPLPEGWGIDKDDVTIVNSDGTAADPKGILTNIGGELNTPPTDSIEGQVQMLRLLKERWPEAKVNYRSNLHLHIRVPGLSTSLTALKRVADYIHSQLYDKSCLNTIEPIPVPTRGEYPVEEEYQGALRRMKRRRVSHHTVLPVGRTNKMLTADSITEFFQAEVPRTKAGNIPMWHAQPRAAVNVRQLLETDTIEFRHFPGTLDEDELRTAFEWCRKFLSEALQPRHNQRDWRALLAPLQGLPWPKFPPYIHWMEVRFRATVRDGTVPLSDIVHNISKIQKGTFTP